LAGERRHFDGGRQRYGSAVRWEATSGIVGSLPTEAKSTCHGEELGTTVGYRMRTGNQCVSASLRPIFGTIEVLAVLGANEPNRPVLKLGPRSSTCMRAFGWQTQARRESEGGYRNHRGRKAARSALPSRTSVTVSMQGVKIQEFTSGQQEVDPLPVEVPSTLCSWSPACLGRSPGARGCVMTREPRQAINRTAK
jgi:hypothetical protein